MLKRILAATCAFALLGTASGDITHWVSEPYQPAVAPGTDLLHPDFNDGSYWTVDLMVTISNNDDWTSTGRQFEAGLYGGQFFYHVVGNRTPPHAGLVSIYPALEFDTMVLSTEADGGNRPPFKDPEFAGEVDFDPQLIVVDAWFDVPPNGGDGDFVIARFTVKLTGEQALLTLEGDSTTFNYGGELFPFSFGVTIGGPQDCNNNGISDYLDLINCDGSPWCSDCNNNWIIDECDIADETSEDCNENGIPDECDIADGTSDDVNGNGIPDECECVGDITGNGVTDQADLGILLALWGYCEGHPNYDPDADLNEDGCINHPDLGILLTDWGCAT